MFDDIPSIQRGVPNVQIRQSGNWVTLSNKEYTTLSRGNESACATVKMLDRLDLPSAVCREGTLCLFVGPTGHLGPAVAEVSGNGAVRTVSACRFGPMLW